MCVEGHFIEYKDFHKEPNPSRKAVLAKLFREISAFANASGGEVVVGKEDETGAENVQPDCVYDWLENDRLTTAINKLSDNLIVFSSHREGDLVRIKILESEDLISAKVDTLDVQEGDCFVRENHEAVKAQGERLRRLLEKKSLSADGKFRALRKIVHYKVSNGMSRADKMNIFDSIFISVNSPRDYINSVFESLMMNEFIFGYKMPLSKYSTMQMHLQICDAKTVKPASSIESNRQAFEVMMNSDHTRDSFFSAHLDEVLCSPQLKAYILEHKEIIEGLPEAEEEPSTD